jgi:hypothetical protein
MVNLDGMKYKKGNFSSYYKFTRHIGIKLVLDKEHQQREYDRMVKLFKKFPKNVCRPVGYIQCLKDGKKVLAILVEHINGRSPQKRKWDDSIEREKLEQNLLLTDLHNFNVKVVKGRGIVVVDFACHVSDDEIEYIAGNI